MTSVNDLQRRAARTARTLRADRGRVSHRNGVPFSRRTSRASSGSSSGSGGGGGFSTDTAAIDSDQIIRLSGSHDRYIRTLTLIRREMILSFEASGLATDKIIELYLILTQNDIGSNGFIVATANVVNADSIIASVNMGANEVTIIRLTSGDGGVKWYGEHIGAGDLIPNMHDTNALGRADRRWLEAHINVGHIRRVISDTLSITSEVSGNIFALGVPLVVSGPRAIIGHPLNPVPDIYTDDIDVYGSLASHGATLLGNNSGDAVTIGGGIIGPLVPHAHATSSQRELGSPSNTWGAVWTTQVAGVRVNATDLLSGSRMAVTGTAQFGGGLRPILTQRGNLGTSSVLFNTLYVGTVRARSIIPTGTRLTYRVPRALGSIRRVRSADTTFDQAIAAYHGMLAVIRDLGSMGILRVIEE